MFIKFSPLKLCNFDQRFCFNFVLIPSSLISSTIPKYQNTPPKKKAIPNPYEPPNFHPHLPCSQLLFKPSYLLHTLQTSLLLYSPPPKKTYPCVPFKLLFFCTPSQLLIFSLPPPNSQPPPPLIWTIIARTKFSKKLFFDISQLISQS